MSQVQPGDRSGQRPGTPPRKAAPPKRPAAKAAPKGRQNNPAPKGRPPGGSGRGPKPPAAGSGAKAGAKGRAPRQNTTITARPPRRFSPSTMAFGSIALVVVIVVVFVIVKVAGGSHTPAPKQTLPAPVAAPAQLVNAVSGVPPSVIDAVGTGSGVTPPTGVAGQPPLTSGGKPEVLFVGAEFCPLCAAERWAMVEAFSRFGTWSGLKTTSSSPWDSDPATPTFTFRSAKYTSPYVDFVFVEHESNDNNGPGTRTLFQHLTTQENTLWTKYSQQLIGQAPGFPFVDFGNKYFVMANSYDPGVLSGLTPQEVANRLSNPTDPVTEGIVGTANYMTAAICKLTNDQPSSVCSASGVQKAASGLKSS